MCIIHPEQVHIKSECKEVVFMVIDRISLILVIIGALNWGSIGLFSFDLVAWLCGGQAAASSIRWWRWRASGAFRFCSVPARMKHGSSNRDSKSAD